MDFIIHPNLHRQREFTGNKQRHLSMQNWAVGFDHFPYQHKPRKLVAYRIREERKEKKRIATHKFSIFLPHFIPLCFSDCFTEIARELWPVFTWFLSWWQPKHVPWQKSASWQCRHRLWGNLCHSFRGFL